MTWARTGYFVAAWLMVAGIVVQFFLAGLGIFGAESFEAHENWGFTALHILPIVMFIFALLGRLPRITIGLIVLLFVLVFIQPIFIEAADDHPRVGAIHVLVALGIYAIAHMLAHRAYAYSPMETRSPTT